MYRSVHIILNVSDNKPRVLYITDVMTTYRTMSLNLSLWFLCCKLKIFVKARLTNLFRVIIKFRRREKIYASAIYIYMGGSRGKLNLTNLITEQSLNSELHSSHYNFYNFFWVFFEKHKRKKKLCLICQRSTVHLYSIRCAGLHPFLSSRGNKFRFFLVGLCM